MALLQLEVAVVFLLILVLVGLVGTAFFFGIFGAAARRDPNRPEGDHEDEERDNS